MTRSRTELKKEKNRLEKLKKMLELIQADFDEMTFEERIPFLVEAGSFGIADQVIMATMLSDLATQGEGNQNLARATRQAWIEMKEKMDWLKKFLWWLANSINERYVVKFRSLNLMSWTEEKGIFIHEMADGHSMKVEAFTPAENVIEEQLGIEGKVTVPPKKIVEFELPGEFLALAKALAGMPISRLKICRNDKCGKIFVQTSQREKKFCSERCQNTVAVRRSRKS